jgi:DnaJ-class molecular chaperone
MDETRITKVRLARKKACVRCCGTGQIGTGRKLKCNKCSGNGWGIDSIKALAVCGCCDGNGFVMESMDCPDCSGEGYRVEIIDQITENRSCESCSGVGWRGDRCSKCFGERSVITHLPTPSYPVEERSRCDDCNGTGFDRMCAVCDGSGRKDHVSETIVPPFKE